MSVRDLLDSISAAKHATLAKLDAVAKLASSTSVVDVTKPSSATAACSLRIIHVNDVYQLRNFAKLRTLIEEQSAGCKNVIVTLSGDFVAPSLLSALDQGQGMIELLNAVGVTHVCFGNHESDVPFAALKHRIAEYRGTWLNSNMRAFEGEPSPPPFDVISLTDEAGGAAARKVGLLGLLIGGVDRGKNYGATYRDGAFGGAAASIEAVMVAHTGAAAAVRAAHPDVDCIVPLTHQDQEEDEELAGLGEYPIVLAGHDHELTVTTHGPLSTPVVKAGQDAQNAVVCDVSWPAGAARGAWPTVTTHVLCVKDYAPDAAVAALVTRAEAPVRELESATLAKLPTVTLMRSTSCLAPVEEVREVPSSKGARYGPCSMAMYLATAMRRCVAADVALVNSGAVRADTQYESLFTYADLQKECPFPSECVVIALKGSVLREAVRASRAGWLADGGPYEESGALQHDLGCKCDAQHTMYEAVGRPLDEERSYQVLVDSYDLVKDPTLLAYSKAHPEAIPPGDAGRPAMTVLVEFFCRELWQMLGDTDGDGSISASEANALFASCDVDQSGDISVDELTAALATRVGSGASRLVAQQMIALADMDESGTISRAELLDLMVKRSRASVFHAGPAKPELAHRATVSLE